MFRKHANAASSEFHNAAETPEMINSVQLMLMPFWLGAAHNCKSTERLPSVNDKHTPQALSLLHYSSSTATNEVQLNMNAEQMPVHMTRIWRNAFWTPSQRHLLPKAAASARVEHFLSPWNCSNQTRESDVLA